MKRAATFTAAAAGAALALSACGPTHTARAATLPVRIGTAIAYTRPVTASACGHVGVASHVVFASSRVAPSGQGVALDVEVGTHGVAGCLSLYGAAR